MKIKKLINSVLACALVCTAVPYVNYSVPESISMTVSAADEYTEGTYGSLTYKAYSDHIEISDCDESVTEVTIPAEIDGLPVTSIGRSAFVWRSSLTEINVSDKNEYYSSENGVLFDKDKTEIIKYPEGKSETEYIIPDSVTSIGENAFDSCESLTDITVPNSVTSIGNWAFAHCESLTGITIPDSVTSIRDSAFFCCKSLTSITIPDSVTSIGEHAFNSCESLTSITIPDSVTSIGDSAFSICSSLTEINVSDKNENYISKDGVLFDKDKTEIIKYPEGKSETEYIIPDSVTSIGNYAFEYCESLTSITIPDGVTSIGNSGFSGCTGLTSVKIPESVTSIGKRAFSSCLSLTSITIPDSVTSIGDSAFSSCISLTSITIPDSVISIGNSAFSDCSSLKSITIENPECKIYGGSSTISDTATIYCYDYSTALVYAERYDKDFVLIRSSEIFGIKGDSNGDGNIDVADIVAISAYVGDSEKNPLDEQSILNGDVHNTGDGLTANDALMIQQYLAGTLTTLE